MKKSVKILNLLIAMFIVSTELQSMKITRMMGGVVPYYRDSNDHIHVLLGRYEDSKTGNLLTSAFAESQNLRAINKLVNVVTKEIPGRYKKISSEYESNGEGIRYELYTIKFDSAQAARDAIDDFIKNDPNGKEIDPKKDFVDVDLKGTWGYGADLAPGFADGFKKAIQDEATYFPATFPSIPAEFGIYQQSIGAVPYVKKSNGEFTVVFGGYQIFNTIYYGPLIGESFAGNLSPWKWDNDNQVKQALKDIEIPGTNVKMDYYIKTNLEGPFVSKNNLNVSIKLFVWDMSNPPLVGSFDLWKTGNAPFDYRSEGFDLYQLQAAQEVRGESVGVGRFYTVITLPPLHDKEYKITRAFWNAFKETPLMQGSSVSTGTTLSQPQPTVTPQPTQPTVVPVQPSVPPTPTATKPIVTPSQPVPVPVQPSAPPVSTGTNPIAVSLTALANTLNQLASQI